jgi:predicted Zn finger-like uncharacterized protein
VNLVTRCPTCGTAFRVQRDQLAAHFGTVRCGKCGSVFNGVAALVEEGGDKLSIDPSPQLGLFDPSRRIAPEPSDAPLPPFMAEEEAPSRWRRWLWLLLAAVAATALAAQAFGVRSELTAVLPELRPAFEALCRAAGCAVPLPRRPELIAIESVDMHNDPERQVYVLNALLKNLGRFAQQYPDLELTLTDAGKPVTRRVLRPAEYLDPRSASRMIAGGIEPRAEEALRVYVDARALRASGYELCIFPHECLKKAPR